METIRILIAYALIVGVSHLNAMELPIKNDKNINESAWVILTDDLITKIAACCDPASRNALMYVSKDLDRLASKKNENILFMDPLILGNEDSAYYMITSCIKGNYNLVYNLLKNGVDSNVYDCLYITPLCLVEQNKHIELAALLCDYGAIKAIVLDEEYEQPVLSAFIQAVYCNEIDSVKKYLSDGVNLNESTLHKCITPLRVAICKKHIGIIELLLAHPDIQVNMQARNEVTALMIAANMGHSDIVKRLLAHPGIQINMQDNSGETALYFAALKSHSHIVELLLRHPDIQVNIQNNDGDTALMCVAHVGHLDMIELLLAHPDTQVSLRDVRGVTALMCAIIDGPEKSRFESVRLLSKNSVNIQDNQGNTALILVVSKGYSDCLHVLLAHPEIQVNKRNNNRDTALTLAASKGHYDSVKLLLAHPKIQVNKPNNNGSTPLHIAIMQGHYAIVELLLAHSEIQVNKPDRYGRTALIVAAERGYSDVVKLLLEHPDIQVDMQDARGLTTLDIATDMNHKEIVHLLQSHGNDALGSLEDDHHSRLKWCVLQ